LILTRLDGLAAFRMHLPKWAVAPTSGAGAARHGGGVNRPGVSALYLSLDVETAVKEYQQVSTLVPPGTLVSYLVTMAQVADFRSGFDASAWGAIWKGFYCDWRELWFNQQPPRYSRHYYDLAKMAESPVKAAALADKALLADVVTFKQRFYPRGWARYDQAQPGTFRLLPTGAVLATVEADYRAMANMIFGEVPALDRIMAILRELEYEINE
jgi:RES domain-containing protein